MYQHFQPLGIRILHFFYAGSGCGSARSPDLDVGEVAVGDELVAHEAQLDLAAQAVQQQHRLTLKGQRREIAFFETIFLSWILRHRRDRSVRLDFS